MVTHLHGSSLHWHRLKRNITGGKRGNVQRGKWDVSSSIWYQQQLCRPDVTQTPFSSFGAIKHRGMSTEPGFTPATLLLLLSAVEVGVFHIVQLPVWQTGLSAWKTQQCRGNRQFVERKVDHTWQDHENGFDRCGRMIFFQLHHFKDFSFSCDTLKQI